MNSPEFSVGPENKEIKNHPTIRLEIFRHDQPAPAGEGETDEQRQLTSQGRKHAQEVGLEKNPDVAMGLVIGSPRKRSQESAYRQLLANEAFAGAELSFDDLKKEVDANLPLGNKMIVSEKLDYRIDKNPEFGAAWGKSYNEGKALVFLFEESDSLVTSLHDSEDFSYSRSAANVAEIVKKYIKVAPVWERVYESNKEKYQDSKEMQRFVGTHQSISETFLLKVIEKTQGREAAREFLDQLPSKNGFDLSQGISVRIIPSEKTINIVIGYGGKTWEVESGIIDEIIKDRTLLDESINKSNEVV